MAKIFIDPGHGGADSGAFANGIKEKNVNLNVALKLAKLLRNNGFDVKLSRETDIFVDLATRSKMSNDFGSDLFISIHHNAGGGDGYEVLHSVHAGKDDRLARLIGEEFSRFQNAHGVGVITHPSASNPKIDYLSVLRLTECEAKVLTEYAFLDSKDSQIIDTAEELSREAYLIAYAVCKYVGIKFKDIGGK